MNATKDEGHGAVAGQVDCHVRQHADGGAAFPYKPERRQTAGDNLFLVTPGDNPGMSLRDYFAAHALAGLLVRNWADQATGKTPDNVHELWAAAAYATADAMLAVRAA